MNRLNRLTAGVKFSSDAARHLPCEATPFPLSKLSGCWRAFTSNWREVTRYDPPFHLDVSVGFTCKQAYVRAQTKMEEHRKRLETLLLDTEDFELIAKLAKLLPVSGWPNRFGR